MTFRKATLDELSQIWEIIKGAIARRAADGSSQWQNGYPNPDVIRNDIARGAGYVLAEGDEITCYAAIFINDEPAYDTIDGQWLTTGDFVVVHRIAVAQHHAGKGLAQEIMKGIEGFALENGINSVKVDTNFDNPAMMKTFEKLGYTYCGEVFLQGAARRAYEKVLQTA